MADFSYSGDPLDSERDELRFLIQDTDPAVPLLTDTELDYLLGKWQPLYQSVTYVAAIAAAVIARKFAGQLDVSADGVSVSVSKLSTTYTDLARQLREEYAEEGAVGGEALIDNILDDFDWDPSIKALEFGRALHDNPGVGRQNYGGIGHRRSADNPLTGGVG